MAKTKISKLAKDLNVALPTVIEFLRKNNIEIDENPNTRVEDNIAEMLNNEFNKDRLLKNKVDRGDVSKRKGPFYPRRSDLLFKRCVRGMIPWMSSSGRDAFRRLHVFVGAPKQFEDSNKVRPEEADRAVTCKYVTLGEISEFLGSKVR